jgi:hypothetical protein
MADEASGRTASRLPIAIAYGTDLRLPQLDLLIEQALPIRKAG